MEARRRRWPYLVAAAVLLALGAYLTSSTEPEGPEPKAVEMPRRQTVAEKQRADARRTLPPAALAPVLPAQPPPRPRDPVLVAMPHDVKDVAMVVEANALRNSDLGEPLVKCFMASAPGSLEQARDAGFDPLSQLDRVSMFDDTLMVSGDFSGLRLPDDAERYGEAKLFHRTRADGEEVSWAVWKGQAMLTGEPEELKRAVDRLEGRGPSEPPVLADSDAYGEVYGLLKTDAVAQLFDGVDPKLGALVKTAAQSVQLHVDAMHDVGVVADLKGTDPQQVAELRKLFGGAVAAARARAAAEGHPEQAQVLDLSRVLEPNGDGTRFRVELGLPYELLKAQLDKCASAGGRRAAQRHRRDAGE